MNTDRKRIAELENELVTLQLNLEHVLRRLEQRPQDYSAKQRTAEIMRAKDAMLDWKAKAQRLEKQNGELRARLVMLSDLLEGQGA